MPEGWYPHEPGDPCYELDWVFLSEHRILQRHWERAWRESGVTGIRLGLPVLLRHHGGLERTPHLERLTSARGRRGSRNLESADLLRCERERP